MTAVSTWSLHRTLGSFYADDYSPSADRRAASAPATQPSSGLPLLELPAELHRRGYDVVQICHFHLPTREPAYLAELRAALAEADVQLDAVLVDDGDLTHPGRADEDESWISGWLDDAVSLGARRARVIAGKSSPTPERLADSGRRLARLAGQHRDVRVVTENWHALLPTAADVHTVLDVAEGSVGLLVDLGNWRGADKYEQLASVAPRAETCHAKCHFTADGPDRADFSTTLQLLVDADYTGPLALIYDGADDDEWGALEQAKAIVDSVVTH